MAISIRINSIMVSEKARERAKRDNRVFRQIEAYMHEITQIAQDPINRHKESIGGFNISPQGKSHGTIRVAWSYDSGKHTLFIHDLLYHETDFKYVDNWARKVGAGKITLEDYHHGNYVSLDEFVYSF